MIKYLFYNINNVKLVFYVITVDEQLSNNKNVWWYFFKQIQLFLCWILIILM